MQKSLRVQIKHHSGRLLGPLDLERVERLARKLEIDGTEEARLLPDGPYRPLNQIEECLEALLRGLAPENDYQPLLGTQAQSENAEDFPPADQGETKLLTPVEPPPIELELEKGAAVPQNQSGGNRELPAPSTGLDIEPTKEILEKTIKVDVRDLDETLIMPFVASEEKSSLPELPEAAPARAKPLREIEKTEYFDVRELLKKGTTQKKGLLMPFLVAAGLAYLAYDTVFPEAPDTTALSATQEAANFKAELPTVNDKKIDPILSKKIFNSGMADYVLDTPSSYRQAAKKLLIACSLDPENVPALAMLASSYMNLIDASPKTDQVFSVAAKLIEIAKAKKIDLLETIIAESEFLMLTGRPDTAIKRIDEFSKQAARFDPSLFYYVARAFYQKGKFSEAAKDLGQFTEKDVFSAKVYYLQGLVALQMGQEAAAEQAFQAAIKKSRQHAPSFLKLAELRFESGKITEMQPFLDQIREDQISQKQYGRTLYLRAQIFSVKQEWVKALKAIVDAKKCDPKSSTYQLEFYAIMARLGEVDANAKQDAAMYYFLKQGEAAAAKGKLDEAVLFFLKGKTASPKSPIPYLMLGDLYLARQDIVNAKFHYQIALKMDPNNIEIGSKTIHALIDSYEFEEARKTLDYFRKLPVPQGSIDKLAGDFYFKQGRYKEALPLFKKSMLRETIDPLVYLSYARLLYKIKAYAEVPFYYSLARQFDPDNPEVVIGSAQAIAQLEGPTTAIQYLKESFESGGFAESDLRVAMGELYLQMGEVEKAKSEANRAMNLNGDLAEPYRLMAKIYLDAERTDKNAIDRALDSYDSFIARNKSDPTIYLEKYRLYLKKKKFELAAQEVDHIFALYPRYPMLRYFKGVLYEQQGNNKIAIEEYLKAHEQDPAQFPNELALGRSMVHEGYFQDALPYLQKAISLGPDSAEARMWAAVANQKLKNYAGAVVLFNGAIKLDPANPIIHKRLGDCLIAMGDLIGAKAAYRKYLEMEPDAQDRRAIEALL